MMSDDDRDIDIESDVGVFTAMFAVSSCVLFIVILIPYLDFSG